MGDSSSTTTCLGALDSASSEALPGGVIEKYLCDAGAIAVTHDAFGRPLDLGREQRRAGSVRRPTR